MKHFPIYLNIEGQRIAVSGGGEAALAKLRLLLKTQARIEVYAATPAPEIEIWAAQGRLVLHRRAVAQDDLAGAALFYGADEDRAEDARTGALARSENVLVNVVDNLTDSQFITPAIVDRDPVTVAIGTEGAAPVLARAIKASLEEQLSPRLGLMARIAKGFRSAAEALPMGRARRDFWRDYYFNADPRADDLQATLEDLLERHSTAAKRAGHVAFVGAGPGDPELLTLKARKTLDEADVVIYDRLVTPEILELARREALMIDVGKEAYGPATPQEKINALIVEHARNGAQVVRLKSGDSTVFGRLDEEIGACDTHDVTWHIVPGITSASAAVASIGQSLTKRGRNGALRFMTGHDMQGFADHDWRSLARSGEVAAIYMGKRAARFIQGRLMMHGADPATPFTIIENASRPDQRVIATTLARLADDLGAANLTGPAISLYGLAPRAAAGALHNLQEQELA